MFARDFFAIDRRKYFCYVSGTHLHASGGKTMSGELIAEVRWHCPDTPDLSDYEGIIPKAEPIPPKTFWQRCRRFCQTIAGHKPAARPIPTHGYDPSTDQTACFFDIELEDPLPLGRYSAYWGFVDSAILEDGIHIHDGWPLPKAINALLKLLVGYHFRVINPTTILLSCWIDGKPDDLEPVLTRTKQLLGFAA